MARRRLDEELVAQGFFDSADDAARAIMAGDVSGDGRRYEHPGDQVRPGCALHVRGHLCFVGRGGLKLEGGLRELDVDPAGLDCLDVGCSTGGFTDCLLKHGARHVTAVDVGRAQFDWSLRNDERVTLYEGTNICDLPAQGLGATADLAVCDVSFTSVTTVLPAVLELLRREGRFLTLVKPQFEAARAEVGAGGIVRDPQVRLACLEKVAHAFEEGGLAVRGACASPIRGHKGNQEFLLLGERHDGCPARPGAAGDGAAPGRLDGALRALAFEGAAFRW